MAWSRAWRSASTRARASNSRALSTPPIVPRGQGGGARARVAAPRVRRRRAYSRSMGEPLLEVAVLHARDVPGAQEGGADRLHLVGAGRRADGPLSPEPALVSAVCRETDLPVFVLLRLNDSWTTTGGELTRLVGLAEDYLGCGAAGVSFGFLDADLEVDTEVCTHLAERCRTCPWTFHRAVDDTLDPRRSWRRLLGLPGLVAVRSRGSPQGHGRRVRRPARHRRVRPGDRRAADARRRAAGRARAVAGPRRRPPVPPRRRRCARAARRKAYVDAGHVRSWRLLLDTHVGRAPGGVRASAA